MNTKQKISKGIEDLNNTIIQLDQTSTQRTINSTTGNYIFFSSAHRILSRTDHVLGPRTSLNKHKNTETYVFWPHRIKLEIYKRRKFGQFTNLWKLNSRSLNN